MHIIRIARVDCVVRFEYLVEGSVLVLMLVLRLMLNESQFSDNIRISLFNRKHALCRRCAHSFSDAHCVLDRWEINISDSQRQE